MSVRGLHLPDLYGRQDLILATQCYLHTKLPLFLPLSGSIVFCCRFDDIILECHSFACKLPHEEALFQESWAHKYQNSYQPWKFSLICTQETSLLWNWTLFSPLLQLIWSHRDSSLTVSIYCTSGPRQVISFDPFSEPLLGKTIAGTQC